MNEVKEKDTRILDMIDSLLMLQPILTVVPHVIDGETGEHYVAVYRD